MKIQTGRGFIPFATLIGIWSISALTSLPGLAISPMLGKLSEVFPDSTQVDLQMLTSLPSLLIIPFIILSGKLTEKINNIYLLMTGLSIFSLCGVLYLLSTQMWQLIAVSALLGVGAGLIIPLSTGLISMFFTGEYRIKQFGLSSSISNLTLVLVTALTGYLAEVRWNLPFVVYLFPIISIILSFFVKRDLKSIPRSNDVAVQSPTNATLATNSTLGKYGIDISHLIQLMLFYGILTVVCVIISLNLPFLIKEYNLSSGISGITISLFFLAMMIPGLFLNKIIDSLKNKTTFYSILVVFIGLSLIVFIRSEVALILGSIFVGFGYGTIQPAIYEKTACIASPKRTTLALAFVMAMNYLAILISPFVYDFFKILFHSGTEQLPFKVNMFIALFLSIWALIKKNTFILNYKA